MSSRVRFSVQPSVTLGLVSVIVLTFFVNWGGRGVLVPALGCGGDWSKPWTFLTYGAVATGSPSEFFWLFCGLWFLYWVGGSLERALGGVGLLGSYFGYGLASAIVGTLVAKGSGASVAFVGPWIPLGALTCLWAGQNPVQEVRLMGVLPLQARWLALLTALGIVVLYGAGLPVLGVAVAAPFALAWFQGTGALFARRPKSVVSGRGHRAQSGEEFQEFIGKVKAREKEREERERLRKLFESSVSDGTSDPEKGPDY